MVVGFEEHGFMVAAKHMPDTCTDCPFWLTDLEMQEDGMCFLTGEVIPTPERTCDTKVMGFVFHYNRTTLRKSILKRATKKAHRIAKKEKVNWYDASAMLASMGWFTHTDTYGFYEDHIKPYVNIKQLKKKVSKHSKKGVKNNDVRMVSVRKYGQADRVGHDIKPDSGLSAKEHCRADQEGH